MLIGFLSKTETKCDRFGEWLASLPRLPLRLAFLCSLLVIFTGGDAVFSILTGYEKVAESVTWQFLEKQIASPLTTFSDREAYHHISKMAFRLFPAYLGKLCPDCSLKGIMLFLVGLEYLAGFLFFFFSCKLLQRYCDDTVAVVWILLGTCFTFLGKIFFWDIYAYFDAYALLFLLLAMYSRNALWVLLFISLAYWTDERSLVSSALVWLWHSLPYSHKTPVVFRRPLLWPNKAQLAILLAVISTLILRQWLTYQYGLSTITGLSQVLSEAKVVLIEKRLIELIPFVAVSSFESYWLLILGALAALWIRREKWSFALLLLALGTSLGTSFMVYDMTRSVMYAFPVIFIAARLLSGEFSPKTFRRLVFWVAIAAVVFPTYYLSHYMWPFFIRLLRFG